MSSNPKDTIKISGRSFLGSLWRSQMTSIISSITQTAIFSFCSIVIGIYYVTSNAIGAFMGAIVSFYLGRNWAFRKRDGKITNQAFKYILTSGTSLILNTYGIYFVTETFHLYPLYSQVLVSILVGVFFNFFMFRYFVYK